MSVSTCAICFIVFGTNQFCSFYCIAYATYQLAILGSQITFSMEIYTLLSFCPPFFHVYHIFLSYFDNPAFCLYLYSNAHKKIVDSSWTSYFLQLQYMLKSRIYICSIDKIHTTYYFPLGTWLPLTRQCFIVEIAHVN